MCHRGRINKNAWTVFHRWVRWVSEYKTVYLSIISQSRNSWFGLLSIKCCTIIILLTLGLNKPFKWARIINLIISIPTYLKMSAYLNLVLTILILERRINVLIVLPFAFLNSVDPRLQDYLVLFAEQWACLRGVQCFQQLLEAKPLFLWLRTYKSQFPPLNTRLNKVQTGNPINLTEPLDPAVNQLLYI